MAVQKSRKTRSKRGMRRSHDALDNNTSALLNRRAQMNALRVKDQELDDIKKDIKELQALVKKLGKG